MTLPATLAEKTRRRSVPVLTPDGQPWRVSPDLLRKVEAGGDPQPADLLRLPLE